MSIAINLIAMAEIVFRRTAAVDDREEEVRLGNAGDMIAKTRIKKASS